MKAELKEKENSRNYEVDKKAQQVRAFAEHACGSKSTSWTLRWKESPGFIELFSDLHMHPLTCVQTHTPCARAHIYTHTNNNLKNLEIL